MMTKAQISERLKGQDIVPTIDCTASYLLGYSDAKKEMAEPQIQIERVRPAKKEAA